MFVIKILKTITTRNPEQGDWSGATHDQGIHTVIQPTRSAMIQWLSATYPLLEKIEGESNRWHFDQVEDEDSIKTPTGKYLCDYDIYLYETSEYSGDLNEPIKALLKKYQDKGSKYTMDASRGLLAEIIGDLNKL
ncbi:hypothetical protein LCGC14_0196020 [marine sediment metagenome]|uniref:Uncharacterized protein n=1 Tax=marine sediment metagenome TaxID=412755 RepID=A0A0F9UQ54_9ZZZZ